MKQHRRLSLKSEALAPLTDNELADVQGAAIPTSNCTQVSVILCITWGIACTANCITD